MTHHKTQSAARTRRRAGIVARLSLVAALLGASVATPAEVHAAHATAPTVATAATPATMQTKKARKSATTKAKRRAARPARGKPTARKARGRAAAPRQAALLASNPRSASALANDLSYLLGARAGSGKWGAMVVSLTRGDTLFARDASQPFTPASTMKLMTTVLALDRLGPDHEFSTDVLRTGAVGPDGTLRGDLVLRGDGDPSLDSRFVRGGPDAPMQQLAEQVAAAGVKRVTGDVIADASAFESRLIPEGWLTRYAGSAYAAPFSALSINENLLWVAVSPGGRGGAAVVALEPATTTVPVVSSVRTVAGRGGKISAHRRGDGAIEVRGTVGAQAGTKRYSLVINDPPMYVAGSLRSALAAKGITVTGQVKMGRTPQGATVIASLRSPPISKLVSAMNRESINHYAELLFRNAARGLKPTQVGSAETGLSQLRTLLQQKAGVDPNAVFAADGSGLSTLDHITPNAMVRMLSYANRAPWSPVFHASLPVAGESELLRHRMRFTAAQGNLHAKTGTTNDVVGLAGYVTAENGELLAFSFIYNGRDRWHAREAIDAMGATMAGFARN